MNEIYQQLRARLDDLSVGFPTTATGIELKILQRLFSEKDAELFLLLSPLPESPEKIAARIGHNQEKLEKQLEDMAKRGLLFRRRKKGEVKYGIVPYMIGLFEFQLKTMDQDLARDFEDYYTTGIGRQLQMYETPLMRTIPINIDFSTQLPVAPYEDVMHIIDSHEIIAISDCVCRVTKQKIGEDCGHPLEACFQFGTSAEYYLENKMGRLISKEEAKAIIKRNEKAGLVLQPVNDQNAASICSCCGCCCAVLRSIKMQTVPAKAVHTNYYALVNADTCTGCGICEKRCHMEAIKIAGNKAQVNLNRCIGCGLCVTTCKPKAAQLVRKTEGEAMAPPAHGLETQMRILKERGKR